MRRLNLSFKYPFCQVALSAILILGFETAPLHADPLATMISPGNGATNVFPTAPFSWTTAAGAQSYYVYVGSAVGLKDVFDSSALSPAVTSLAVPRLHPNTNYWIRLWTKRNDVWASVDSSFASGAGPSQLTFPINNQTQVDSSLPFTWFAVSQAQSYQLDLGTAPGRTDIFSTGATSQTSAQVSGVMANTMYFARLTTKVGGNAYFVDTSFATGAGLAHLIQPANGATNVSPASLFTWNGVPGAQAYILYVGTTAGASDVYRSTSSLATQITVPGLGGGTLYFARLWTETANVWNHAADTSFTTAGSAAHLTNPANGASNTDPYQPFTWGAVANAVSYSLAIGSAPGGTDVWASGNVTGTSLTVPGLSQNTKYYARLWTNTSSGSAFSDSSFQTGTGLAHLISPAAGATGVDPFGTFSWNAIPGAQNYYLYVGSTPGGTDIVNTGSLLPQYTSMVVYGLQGGRAYYLTLWTYIGGSWQSVASTITTAAQQLMDPASLRSTVQAQTQSVRGMTVGVTNTPVAGSPLAAQVARDGVAYAFCGDYARALATQLTLQRITARIRNTTFNGDNYQAHVTVEYFDTTLDKWIVADATFGYVFWNPATAQGLSIDQLSSFVNAQNWSAIQPYITYTTPAQAPNPQAYSHNYYMDPLLLYLNPVTLGLLTPVPPVPNSPVPFLSVHDPSEVGTAGNWLFGFLHTTDSVTISDPASGSLNLPALSGTIYSKAANLNRGWSITAQPGGMQILSMRRYLFP